MNENNLNNINNNGARGVNSQPQQSYSQSEQTGTAYNAAAYNSAGGSDVSGRRENMTTAGMQGNTASANLQSGANTAGTQSNTGNSSYRVSNTAYYSQQPNGQYRYTAQNMPYRESAPINPASEKLPKKKKSGKSGFAAAVIAAALVVGGAAGFAGTVLGNNILQTGTQQSTSEDTSSANESEQKTPASTIDLNASQIPKPLDESKINDSTNSTLLNAEELYEKVKNTVVIVYNYQDVIGYVDPVKYAFGSGVIFTSDGYVITNHHVVEGATKLVVAVNNYEDPDKMNEYEAELIGSDSLSDLAVLKIVSDESFDYAMLGDSDTVRVGQDICVLGNPKQLVSSLTKGIVSGLGRASVSGSAYGTSTIQIDAAINSGNSGGALFDMYGNVIGIIDYKIVSNDSTTVENLGFAITINDAKPVINDLMTEGYVTNRAGLGINGESISEYSAYIQGLESPGVYVTYINEDKPVAKSGLKVGDIITKVNGTEVVTILDVQNIVGNLNVGDTVELTVLRQGANGRYSSKILTVELSEIELS